MNRTFSTITVLAMLLIAVGLCVKQTIDAQEAISGQAISLLYAAEAVVGGLVIVAAVTLLRQRFARNKTMRTSRRQVPAIV